MAATLTQNLLSFSNDAMESLRIFMEGFGMNVDFIITHEREIIDMIMHPKFNYFDGTYDGPLKDIHDNQLILITTSEYHAIISGNDNPVRQKVLERNIDYKYKLFFATAVLLVKWLKNKQVYNIGENILDALLYEVEAGKNPFVSEIMLHPRDDVYMIPINAPGESINNGYPFGIIVGVLNSGYKYIPIVYPAIITDNYNMGLLLNKKYACYVDFSEHNAYWYPKMRKEDSPLLLGMKSMELLSQYRSGILEITENPLTKDSYNPGQSIKNKYRELRIWDVAVKPCYRIEQ